MKAVKTYNLDPQEDADVIGAFRRMFALIETEKLPLPGVFSTAAGRLHRENKIDADVLEALYAMGADYARSKGGWLAFYAIRDARDLLVAREATVEINATRPRWEGWPAGSDATYLGRVPPQRGHLDYMDAWFVRDGKGIGLKGLTLVRRYGPGEGDYLLFTQSEAEWIEHWRNGGVPTLDYTVSPTKTCRHVMSSWLETLHRLIAQGHLDPDGHQAQSAA